MLVFVTLAGCSADIGAPSDSDGAESEPEDTVDSELSVDRSCTKASTVNRGLKEVQLQPRPGRSICASFAVKKGANGTCPATLTTPLPFAHSTTNATGPGGHCSRADIERVNAKWVGNKAFDRRCAAGGGSCLVWEFEYTPQKKVIFKDTWPVN